MKKRNILHRSGQGGTLTRIAMLDSSLKLADSASFATEEEFQAFAGKLCSVLQEWKAIDAPLVIASRGAFSRQEVREGIAAAVNSVSGGKADLKAVISDAEAAHYAAFGGESGILLISGTGAVAFSGRYGNYAKHGGKTLSAETRALAAGLDGNGLCTKAICMKMRKMLTILICREKMQARTILSALALPGRGRSSWPPLCEWLPQRTGRPSRADFSMRHIRAVQCWSEGICFSHKWSSMRVHRFLSRASILY